MLKYGSHIKKEGIWSFHFLDNAHYISEKKSTLYTYPSSSKYYISKLK